MDNIGAIGRHVVDCQTYSITPLATAGNGYFPFWSHGNDISASLAVSQELSFVATQRLRDS
jgi:hypothetical protein